jgi:dihydrofolate reductase
LTGKLCVLGFSISLDGYGAGPNQDLINPLGVGGLALHEWHFATRTFRETHGIGQGGTTDVDDTFAAGRKIGSWIMGRNMFGPIRGPWPDQNWRGWWGEDPPFHTQVFVLTHYQRPPIPMKSRTTFNFVTDGIESALKKAREAADGKDIHLAGGVATIREYLKAGLVDEMHLAITPILLGTGEHLLHDIDLPKLGYRCVEHAASQKATHVLLTRN